MRRPKTRNGAKGISVFIDSRGKKDSKPGVFVLSVSPSASPASFDKKRKSIMPKDAAAPIQKLYIIAVAPAPSPKSQPMPSASFASPRPIHLPPETSHSK